MLMFIDMIEIFAQAYEPEGLGGCTPHHTRSTPVFFWQKLNFSGKDGSPTLYRKKWPVYA